MVGKLIRKALKTKIRYGTEQSDVGRWRSQRERKITRVDKYAEGVNV